jgi:hypothetical protein
MHARSSSRIPPAVRVSREAALAASGTPVALGAALFLIEALRCATLLMYGIRACMP